MSSETGRFGAFTSDEQLSAALNAIPAAFVIYGPDDRIVLCNDAYRQEYAPFQHRVQPGVSHTDLQWLKFHNKLDPEAGESGEAYVKMQHIRHKTGPAFEELRDKSGRYVRLQRTRLPDGSAVGLRFDITDLRNSQIELEKRSAALEDAKDRLFKLAMTDGLTGLQNRRASGIALKKLARKCSQSHTGLALLNIDLDGFKRINDRFGHDVGDAVLKAVGERLSSVARDADHISRMGGDEFLVATMTNASPDELSVFAETVINTVSEPVDVGNAHCRFGVSIGVAYADHEDIDTGELIKSADFALYRSKEAGRNRYTLFDSHLNREMEERVQLSQDLLGAAEREELVVFLQPVMDAQSRVICGAEALVRWQHPTRGLMSPGPFLPVAEGMKSIGDIDNFVLRKVLSLQEEGRLPAKLPKVSINLSPMTLRDGAFIDVIRDYEFASDVISFEILETVFAEDADSKLQWNLDQLREMGFELAIDDFGTGHSSIASVITLRPHWLKIDRRFTAEITTQDTAREVARLTVALSRVLGASVTAEGVETAEQADLLTELGCDRLQGYYFGKPMPVSDFVELMIAQQSEDAGDQGNVA